MHYFAPHKKLFFLDMTCALLVSFVDLAYPYISRKAMYTWLPNDAYRTFFTVMAIVAAAYLVRALLYFVITYWGHQFGVRVEADMRADLFRKIQSMSYSFFDRNRTGYLLSRVTTDLFEITELSHHGPEDLLISVVTIVGAITIMFTIEWRLALMLAILMPIFVITVSLTRRFQQRTALTVKKRTGLINTEIESALAGIRTGKAFANEDIEYEKFRTANEKFKISKKDNYKAFGLFNSTMEFFCGIMSVAVVTMGGWLLMKGSITYVDLFTFSLYITTFIAPVKKLATSAELFIAGFAGMARFREMMGTETDMKDAEDAEELVVTDGRISIKDVHFSYDSAEILHGIDLEIEPGETIAVVGSSGGGKTTLCQLIPRFYDVDRGSISIDGSDVRNVTQKSLHRAIGIVQQDVFLFAGTVFENISYGRPGASLAEVEEAARKAEIYEDVMAMPDGFDTYVGERGVLLSGGQKQRIAIARIFLKNPPILILDEATSALDSVTESKIQSAFDELAKGRTTLIIAHRLSTIRKAGRIIVIDDGEIKESGSHEELMAKGGAYALLYDTQTRIH